MAKCQDCNKDMLLTPGCDFSKIKIANEWYERNTEFDASTNGMCHDCNAKHGNYHHYGCDVERCPKCGGQLISCGCNGNEDCELRR